MNRIWIALGAIALVVGFQNCSSGASFSAVGELVAKPDGSGTETTLIDNGGSTNPPTDGLIPPKPPVSTPPVSTTPPNNYPPQAGHDDEDDHHHGHDRDHHDNDNDYEHEDGDGCSEDSPHHTPKHTAQNDDDKLQYVCVLKGNGKSTKIALTNSGLDGKVGTPQDVCMSENACVNIISERFDVQGAEERGFCKGKNKKVVKMTDIEIEAAITQAKLIELTAMSKDK